MKETTNCLPTPKPGQSLTPRPLTKQEIELLKQDKKELNEFCKKMMANDPFIKRMKEFMKDDPLPSI